ncbi:hypothetical protein [Actinocatenispora rupis]|uniref:Uncharacterized protein n=1 Tax=Actinocatenispora rupis TaxID=519421 RepID=A0A8J3NCC5_9ACTN|nr:hypothetical protein [Actinocatenispora rupis]GID13911.1 hypothetical protein Aru02nite_48000 [Actinocatenispora rupis]
MDDTSAELRAVRDTPYGAGATGDPRRPAVLLAVLGIAGVALLWPVLAPFPGTVADHRGPGGWPQVAGGLALAGAGIAVAVVVTRLTRIAQSVAGGDYGAVARAAATACAALIGAAAAALAEPAVTHVLGGPPDTDPALLPRLGYVLLTLPGMVAAALAVLGTAFAVWRAGRISTILAVLGFASAIALLAGIFAVPVVVLPGWLVAAAFTIRR